MFCYALALYRMGQPAGITRGPAQMNPRQWETRNSSSAEAVGWRREPCLSKGGRDVDTGFVICCPVRFLTWNVLRVKSGWLYIKANKKDLSNKHNRAQSCESGHCCLPAPHQTELRKPNPFRQQFWPRRFPANITATGNRCWPLRQKSLAEKPPRGTAAEGRELGTERPSWGHCPRAPWGHL